MEIKTLTYETPQVEIMEIEVEQAMLQASNMDPQYGQGW